MKFHGNILSMPFGSQMKLPTSIKSINIAVVSYGHLSSSFIFYSDLMTHLWLLFYSAFL